VNRPTEEYSTPFIFRAKSPGEVARNRPNAVSYTVSEETFPARSPLWEKKLFVAGS
jgi:hypothetical protein